MWPWFLTPEDDAFWRIGPEPAPSNCGTCHGLLCWLRSPRLDDSGQMWMTAEEAQAERLKGLEAILLELGRQEAREAKILGGEELERFVKKGGDEPRVCMECLCEPFCWFHPPTIDDEWLDESRPPSLREQSRMPVG